MELEQFKARWNQLEQRVDANEALALQAWCQPRQQQVQQQLTRFGAKQLGWLLLWITLALLAGSFWFEHRHSLHLLLSGLALHLYAITAIAATLVRMHLGVRLDSSDGVIDQLRRLARLRRFTTLSEVLIGLPWWCLWLLLLQLSVLSISGIDLYALAPTWFLSNLLFGAVAMLACFWLARRWDRNPPRARWLQRAIDNLSGRNLAAAQAQLQEIERFEHD